MPDAPLCTAISLEDVYDNGNASDLRVYVTLASDQTNVLEYRVFIISTDQVANFTVNIASDVPSTRYRVLETYHGAGTSVYFNYYADSKDAYGNVITNLSYSIVVLTVGKNGYTNALTSPSNSVTLTNMEDAIVLIGSPLLNVDYGATFTDPGAIASDETTVVATYYYVGNSVESIDTSASGTYTIRYNATGLSEVTRTVIVGLELGQGYSFATAWLIPINDTITGTISEAGRSDYYKFVAPENGSYTIRTIGDSDTYGLLYNSSYALMAEDDDSGDEYNFSITQSLTAGQTYYVEFYFLDSEEVGTYNIQVLLSVDTNVLAVVSTSTSQALAPSVNIVTNISVPGMTSAIQMLIPSIVAVDNAIQTISASYNLVTPDNFSALLIIIASDSSGIIEKRWAYGSQTIEYMREFGTITASSTPTVWNNGTYTVYAKDGAGNDGIATTTISGIVFPIDFDAGFLVGLNLGKGDDGKIGDYGIDDDIIESNMLLTSGGYIILA